MNDSKQKVVIIIQARMGSTRLFGKVMKKIMGRPLLSYLIERVRRVESFDQLVVATTNSKDDDVIELFCSQHHLLCFRGDEHDVLNRFYKAANKWNADAIVRITGDCPLIDPAVVDRVIQTFLRGSYDYVSNTLELTYPRGMDTEVFSMKALEKTEKEANTPSEREHVTLRMYQHPKSYRLQNVAYEKNRAHYRLTVDTEDDFRLVEALLTRLYPKNPNFSLEEIISLLDQHPELAEINAHVVQKPVEQGE